MDSKTLHFMQINCNFHKDVTLLKVLQPRNVRIIHSDENVIILNRFFFPFNTIHQKNYPFPIF